MVHINIDYKLLLENFLKFEDDIFKSGEEGQLANFFLNEDSIKDIYDFFLIISTVKHLNIIKIKEKLNNKLTEKINKNIDEINNKILDFYISLFIYKSLFTDSMFFTTKENYFKHSDTIINTSKDMLYNLLIFIEIKFNIKIDINNKELRFLMWSCFEILHLNKKINKIKFWKNNKKYYFYHIDKQIITITPMLYFTKFKVYNRNNSEKFLFNNHYTSIQLIFEKNLKSQKYLKYNVDSKSIENLLDFKAKISRENLEIIFEKLIKYYDIKKETINKNYLTLKKAYVEKLNFKIDVIREISQELSIYENLIKIKNILNIKFDDRFVYFPFKFDFRGRQYMLSEISPTFYKEFRYCLYTGFYANNEKEKEHEFSPIIKEILNNNIHLLIELKFKTELLSLWDKQNLIWLLVSCSEIFKNQLGKKVSIKDFIKKGIEIVNNIEKIKFKDIYDEIKTNYIINIINEMSTSKIKKKWLISKDATGSCFHHLIKTLGAFNEESLKLCNLNSKEYWYDTYAYIIDGFLEKNKNNFHFLSMIEIGEIFNRITLKKTIMTKYYSAGILTCKKYFLEKINIEKYDEDQKKEIITFFNKFYYYVGSSNIILKEKISNIQKELKKRNYKINFVDESEIDISYYKTIEKRIEFKYNNKRFSKKEVLLNIEVLDNKKLKTATIANYIQALDAVLVRWYLLTEKTICVHDCFYTDYKNTTFLICKLNEGMRIVFHDLNINKIDNNNIFSPFIVL